MITLKAMVSFKINEKGETGLLIDEYFELLTNKLNRVYRNNYRREEEDKERMEFLENMLPLAASQPAEIDHDPDDLYSKDIEYLKEYVKEQNLKIDLSKYDKYSDELLRKAIFDEIDNIDADDYNDGIENEDLDTMVTVDKEEDKDED